MSIEGIASLQIFTLLQIHDINYIKKYFLNLRRVEFMLEKPKKPIYKKDQKFNKLIGTAITVTGSKNCQEIIDFLTEKYNIDVDILISGNVILINTVMPSGSIFKSKIGRYL